MAHKQDILISLAARYAEKIFAEKSRWSFDAGRCASLPALPCGFTSSSPWDRLWDEQEWRRYMRHLLHCCGAGLVWCPDCRREEFFEYFRGVTQGIALVLEGAKRLRRSLSLDSLRRVVEGFNPPQFFVRLTVEHPLFSAVTTSPSRSG